MANGTANPSIGDVAANIPTYLHLVGALRDVEYAPADVADLQEQMKATRACIVKEEKDVAILHGVTKKLLKEWHDSQGSGGKRLWAKIKHTSEHKDLTPYQAAKEKAYTDANEREQSYRLRIRVLEGKEAELVQRVKDLQPVVAEHTKLRGRLDTLYNNVFRANGAAAMYPEQDAAERSFESARAWLRELEPMLDDENKVLENITTAHDKIIEVVYHMRFAHRIVMNNGSEGAQIEAQRAATAAAQAAVKAYDTARKIKPTLESVVMPRTVLSDMFRFCGWSAIGRTDVERALGEARVTQSTLKVILDKQREDAVGIDGKTERARVALKHATDVLEEVRRRIFETAAAMQTVHPRSTIPVQRAARPASVAIEEASLDSRDNASPKHSARSSMERQPFTRPPSYATSGPGTRLNLHSLHAGLPPATPESPAQTACALPDNGPLSPPPTYGQPATYSPSLALARVISCDSASQYSTLDNGSSSPITRVDTRSTINGTHPSLTPVTTRDLDSPSDLYQTYSHAPTVQSQRKTMRSMSVNSAESNYNTSPIIKQRPLPRTPIRPPLSETFTNPNTPPPRPVERRANTLPAEPHHVEPERPRALTLPSPIETFDIAPVPEHEPQDLAKLRMEGERALQEVQRATEELDRIRRELVNRAGTRGSDDSDIIAVSDPRKSVARRGGQAPPPSYTVQKRDDERGLFYITN